MRGEYIIEKYVEIAKKYMRSNDEKNYSRKYREEISRVRFNFADGVIAKVLDQVGINGTEEQTGFRKGFHHWFMVVSGAFQHDTGFAFQTANIFGEFIHFSGYVIYVKGLTNNNTCGLQD